MCYIYAGKMNARGLENLRVAATWNKHGVGIYCFDCKKIQKSLDIKQLSKLYNQHKEHIVVAHLRFASAGEVNLDNTHPMYSKDIPLILFHNGTNRYIDVPYGSTKSDTRLLFEHIAENYRQLRILKFLRSMKDYDTIGNYILINAHEKKMYIAFNSGKLYNTYFTTSGKEAFYGEIDLDNGKPITEQLEKLKRVDKFRHIRRDLYQQLKDEYYDDLVAIDDLEEIYAPTKKEKPVIEVKNSIFQMTSMDYKNEYELEFNIDITRGNKIEKKTIKLSLPFEPARGKKIKLWRKIHNFLKELELEAEK